MNELIQKLKTLSNGAPYGNGYCAENATHRFGVTRDIQDKYVLHIWRLDPFDLEHFSILDSEAEVKQKLASYGI